MFRSWISKYIRNRSLRGSKSRVVVTASIFRRRLLVIRIWGCSNCESASQPTSAKREIDAMQINCIWSSLSQTLLISWIDKNSTVSIEKASRNESGSNRPPRWFKEAPAASNTIKAHRKNVTNPTLCGGTFSDADGRPPQRNWRYSSYSFSCSRDLSIRGWFCSSWFSFASVSLRIGKYLTPTTSSPTFLLASISSSRRSVSSFGLSCVELMLMNALAFGVFDGSDWICTCSNSRLSCWHGSKTLTDSSAGSSALRLSYDASKSYGEVHSCSPHRQTAE